MYKVGDKVSHPVHGAGVIQDIEIKEILGEEQSYYTIGIPSSNIKLMVSTEKADEVGIRKVVNKSKMESILDSLTKDDVIKNPKWIERNKINVEKVKSGNIDDVVNVVKELYAIQKQKPLSATEKRIYSNAKQILLSELSLVKNLNAEEAEKLMKDALNKSIVVK